jgi:tRNA nucleotidyltransferase/poly(A) polymerase
MQRHSHTSPANAFISNIPEFVTFIIGRLKAAGHVAFVVGGAIRNAYLGRPVTDWDVATSASPAEIKAVFQDQRHFALKHGTVTLLRSGQPFEVTSFRGPKASLADDLSRRDFTINAMAFDPEKNEIHDPHGGLSDARRKRIQAVLNPKARFLEDPLRLLRAVRLATEFGFQIETGTLRTLPELAPMLQKVATERIREELLKVLMSSKPSLGFNLMARTGLLKQILPEVLEGVRKRQNHHHRYTIYKHIMETMDRVDASPILRLTALFHDIAKPRVRKKVDGRWRFLGHETSSADLAAEIMNRLKFSRHVIDQVVNLIRHHMIGYRPQWSDGAVRRLIRRVGTENIMDLIGFRRADVLAHGLDLQEMDLLRELEARVKVAIEGALPMETRDLAINGHMVMETLGIKQGQQIGKILNELMEKVTDHPHLNTKKHLIAILEKMKPLQSA